MASELSELQRCKRIIEKNLDWGPSNTWQTNDFENLSQLILDKTGVSLSVSTLRRIWGRVEYNHLPSGTTLNTLAKFAGYTDWRGFAKQQRNTGVEIAGEPDVVVSASLTKQWEKMVWPVGVILTVAFFSIVGFNRVKPQGKVLDKRTYSFGSRPVTRGIPNSVIFTYDASASPTDSVFIQQSWDPRAKVLVDKNLHSHTSVYYEPGVHTAKLIVGDQVVKEHQLVVPTNGWMALIGNSRIPVYLKPQDFIKKDMLRIPISLIKENNIALQPQPSYARYFNVGNFEPVPLSDFSFSADMKNEFGDGAGACQFSHVLLFTDDVPIIIQLSIKGCVSEISLRSVDDFLSGKKADLSALGVDFSDWAHVSCKSSGNQIQYYINDKLAFEFPVPKRKIRILGFSFGFQGTGSVKDIKLGSKNKVVFEAFRAGIAKSI